MDDKESAVSRNCGHLCKNSSTENKVSPNIQLDCKAKDTVVKGTRKQYSSESSVTVKVTATFSLSAHSN